LRETIKAFPCTSGIYKITSPTGRDIGEANSLKERCAYYLHPERIKLQRAIYNSLIKHSVELHQIEVIELCEKKDLFERERYWQEFYNSVDKGLNCFLTNTQFKKKKLSMETRSIMREKALGDKNAFYGKKHTQESLLKISLSSKGVNNPNYGSKFKSEAYIKKQIESNSKKPLKVVDTLTAETFIFMNSKECAKALNIADGGVRMAKNNYKLKRRYLITDFAKC